MHVQNTQRGCSEASSMSKLHTCLPTCPVAPSCGGTKRVVALLRKLQEVMAAWEIGLKKPTHVRVPGLSFKMVMERWHFGEEGIECCIGISGRMSHQQKQPLTASQTKIVAPFLPTFLHSSWNLSIHSISFALVCFPSWESTLVHGRGVGVFSPLFWRWGVVNSRHASQWLLWPFYVHDSIHRKFPVVLLLQSRASGLHATCTSG